MTRWQACALDSLANEEDHVVFAEDLTKLVWRNH
jgi:hypothetical protein